MAKDIEILYPQDATGGPDSNSQFSEDLKIVSIARLVRSMQIGSEAHVAVVGLLSTAILMQTEREMERERSSMKETLWRVRNKLLQCHLDQNSIRVYVPFQCVPVQKPGQVMLFARNSAPPPVKPYLWGQPKIQLAVHPEVEASLNMEYDLKARTEDEKKEEELRLRALNCEIEITVWNHVGHKWLLPFPNGKVTLVLGPDGLQEVSGEATILTVRLLEALNLGNSVFGQYSKVEISIKGEGTLNIERGKAQRLLAEWESSLKASIKAQIRIPNTTIVLPEIEVEGYVDNDLRPGIKFKLTVYKW